MLQAKYTSTNHRTACFEYPFNVSNFSREQPRILLDNQLGARHEHVLVEDLSCLLVRSQGTFYGNNGWAGSCAGNIGGFFPGKWPPAGSYLTSLQPGSSIPVNVALNGPMYSTAMCGKLLYIKASGEDAGCKTCGMTPVPDKYMLARVTNVCPECLYGSVDFGVQGDGRYTPNTSFLIRYLQKCHD